MEEKMLIEEIEGAGGAGGEEEEAYGYDQEAGMDTSEDGVREGGDGSADQDSEPPTSIIVTNIKTVTFDDPDQREVFESLFNDIDESATFQYFKSFRRVRVNFSSPELTTQARDKFHMTEYNDETIKCYFTQPIILGTTREGGPHLQPPKREKQFLISPPASPPVGWEPIEEAEPIINFDLVSAVAGLAPGEAHELHPAVEDKPGIIVHICKTAEPVLEPGGAKPRIIQTRRPTPQ